jgi:tetraacyldisaccharide 4'-kinase
MILLRKILFPFAVLYGLVTQFRNFLYDHSILKSYRFDLPIIAVGNLSVGGTGKTPQIESLIRLLSAHYRIATLSRGYKRQSKGFVLADSKSTAAILGDEPYQFHQKFPNIQVAVDADRKNGIEELLSTADTRGAAEQGVAKPEVILLDDAFQHRRVKAGFYILLTSYGDLFSDDFMLPTGNLREPKSGAKRADVIVVTKCPESISDNEMESIRKKLKAKQPVFFSTIAYDDSVYSRDNIVTVDEIRNHEKLLLAGIAKPEPFFAYLQGENDQLIRFPDHHHFTAPDLITIKEKAQDKIIITTEKDYVRLKGQLPAAQLFYLPIKTALVKDQSNFNQIILNYVGTSTTDR